MEEIDGGDLTQLLGVTSKRRRVLRERGSDTLYEVAEANVDDLAADAGVRKKMAQQMIAAANDLLRNEGE